MREKILWIRSEYLQWILQGRKTVEVRVAYANIVRLQPGDCLLLNKQYPYRITQVNHYRDFPALLAAEEPAAIAPDLPVEELLAALRAIYPAEKEALGAVALHIEAEPIE